MKYYKDKFGKPTNPYSWDAVVERMQEKKNDKKIELPSEAEQMLTNPIFNQVAKWLNVDTRHEWAKYYQKVFLLVDYAVHRTQSKDINHIIAVLQEKLANSPQVAEKRIDDLCVAVQLEQKMKDIDHNGTEIKEDKKEEVLDK